MVSGDVPGYIPEHFALGLIQYELVFAQPEDVTIHCITLLSPGAFMSEPPHPKRISGKNRFNSDTVILPKTETRLSR